MRAQVAEVTECFPEAASQPLHLNKLYPAVTAIRSYGAGYSIKWLTANRPHPTIGKDHSQKPTRWRIDGNEHRPTTEELAAIFSFPPAYVFAGNADNAWNRMGNSVPPLFMRAIAAKVAQVMFGKTPWQPDSNTDYPAILEAAWQQHLAPREPDAPTVVSLFAGCGGSSLGYSMAGFRELLAVEWNDNAVETFKLNFPGVPVYHGDIAKLSAEECLSLAGLEPGQLDVLDGSPPCQGFSTAGKRNLDDPRNGLFREYVRLLRGLRPKVFVMENVSGMVKGKMKLVFAEAMRELKGSGYRVSARLMNAMYFHVPQSRQRLIFIGVREDVGKEPSHPKAQANPTGVKLEHSDSGPWMLSEKRQQYLVNHRAKHHARGNGWGFQVYDGSEPCFTLFRNNSHSASPILVSDAGQYRLLTTCELKQIGSYPQLYQFVGTYDDVNARIGNSVPPLFMRAIARHIRQELLT